MERNEPIPSDNTYVTNLAPNITADNIKAAFAVYGATVVQCKVLPSSTMGQGTCAALVRFSSVHEATQVVKSMQGCTLPGFNEPIRIKFANFQDVKGGGIVGGGMPGGGMPGGGVPGGGMPGGGVPGGGLPGGGGHGGMLPGGMSPGGMPPSGMPPGGGFRGGMPGGGMPGGGVPGGGMPGGGVPGGDVPGGGVPGGGVPGGGGPGGMLPGGMPPGGMPPSGVPPGGGFRGGGGKGGGMPGGGMPGGVPFAGPVSGGPPAGPGGSGHFAGPGGAVDHGGGRGGGHRGGHGGGHGGGGGGGGGGPPERPLQGGGPTRSGPQHAAHGLDAPPYAGKGHPAGPYIAQEPNNNLYIRGLPPPLDNAGLGRVFGRYGEISQCLVLNQTPQHEGGKRAGLVRYASAEVARSVKESLDGNVPEGLVDAVKIEYASPPDGVKGEGKGMRAVVMGLESRGVLPGGKGLVSEENTLYIAGLPPDTDEQSLYRLFAPFGAIAPRGVRAVLNTDGTCKGIAFVNYLDPAAAQAAIQVFNGTWLPDGTVMKVATKMKKKPPEGGPVMGPPDGAAM